MKWNNIRKDAEKMGSIPDTLSGTAKKLRSIFTTFTKYTKNTALDFTTQSARKLNETAMLEAERRKAEATTIIHHNALC